MSKRPSNPVKDLDRKRARLSKIDKEREELVLQCEALEKMCAKSAKIVGYIGQYTIQQQEEIMELARQRYGSPGPVEETPTASGMQCNVVDPNAPPLENQSNVDDDEWFGDAQPRPQRLVQTGGSRPLAFDPDVEDDNHEYENALLLDQMLPENEPALEHFLQLDGPIQREDNSDQTYSAFTVNFQLKNLTDTTRQELIGERLFARLLDMVYAEDTRRPLKTGIALTFEDGKVIRIAFASPEHNSPTMCANCVDEASQSSQGVSFVDGPVSMRVVCMYRLGAAGRTGEPNSENFIDIPTNDFYCIPRAIVLGMALALNNGSLDYLLLSPDILLTKVRELLTASGCNLDLQLYDMEDVKRIQGHLQANEPDEWRIVILDGNYKILENGPIAKRAIVVQIKGGHARLVKDYNKLWSTEHPFCLDCKQIIKRRRKMSHHAKCPAFCKKCLRFGFGRPCAGGPSQACSECGFYFATTDCFDDHRRPGPNNGQSTCEQRKLCAACNKPYFTGSVHKCPMSAVAHFSPPANQSQECVKCNQKHVKYQKFCHIRVPKQGAPNPILYGFFDIETMVIDGKHVPNCVVVDFQCTECISAGINFDSLDRATNCVCIYDQGRQFIFTRFQEPEPSPLQGFVDLLIKRRPGQLVKTILFSHNGGKFDTHLVLEELLARQCFTPQTVVNGLKVYSLKLTGRHYHLLFRDSVNFFARSLAQLPAMFGFTDVKGYFPHKINSFKWLNRTLTTLPPFHFYEPSFCRSTADYQKMRSWWQTNYRQTFNVSEELVKYCRQDVKVLRQACLAYRNSIMQTNFGMDPYLVSSTQPRLSLEIYLQHHMPRASISNIPENGMRIKDRQSILAIRYFRTLELLDPSVEIRDASWVIGEARFNDRLRVDGVILDKASGNEKGAVEFLGCYWHGCPDCFTDRNTKLAGNVTAGHLWHETKKRLQILEQSYSNVSIKWECEFRRELQSDSQLRALYEQTYYIEPLHPRRDCLYGGRVELFKAYHKCTDDEEISHFDFVSLYPHVMKSNQYPVGEPFVYGREHFVGQKWSKPADIPFKGLFKVRVAPPKAGNGPNYLPLQRRTASGALVFCECATCSDAEKPPLKCRHSDIERSWIAGYTHVSLNRALSCGYTIMEIFEVYHWEKWSSDLFGSYVNTFLKQKVEASGWPANCQDDASKKQFIEDYLRLEGILISLASMEDNPGLRAAAKLLLNTLWGKLCQRLQHIQVDYARTETELMKLITDQRYDLLDLTPINGIDRVQRSLRAPFVRTPETNAVHIACFVTEYARDLLYEAMCKIPKGNLLYVDTDAVIFVHKINQSPIQSGCYLGQLTNERPGRKIVEFVSGGPRNYGYKHVDESTGDDPNAVAKVRGFTLNYSASKLLNYETMRSRVLKVFEKYSSPDLYIPHMNISRTRSAHLMHGTMYKKYSLVYRKGFLHSDYYIHNFGCTCNICSQ